jgi:hypothetical protein
MPREVANEKRRDDKFQSLKRRVSALARLDGELLLLEEGPFVVRLRGGEPRSTKAVVLRLRADGVLDRATLERTMKLEGPPLSVDVHVIAAAHRDVRVLSQQPSLDLAREHRRALARYGVVDAEWLRKKSARIEEIASILQRAALDREGRVRRTKEDWFESVVELVRAMRGDEEARALAAAAARIRARPNERRREARERVDVLVGALRSDEAPADPELAALAERLDSARELPGRARRRRVLDVLRRAVGWPTAPTELLVPALGAQDIGGSFHDLVEQSGATMASSLPALRDPAFREQNLELLAHLGLLFTIGDEGVPLPDEEETEAASLLRQLDAVAELAPSKLSLAKAIALMQIPMKRPTRLRVARWVKDGLELELVAEAAEKKHIENLARVPDVRAARAYATWATRLSAHYEAQGVAFSLSPELFANLPKNEDLAVLALCLMEHVDPKSDSAGPDPIAVLDATLVLFQKLPAKAGGILGSLRGTKLGEARRLHPDFAAWLEDDLAIDRLLHIAAIAGEPALSSAIREDFEHASRAARERAHLEKLEARSAPQQGRLDALLRAERTLAGSPKSRTRRRIAERTEQLLPRAYRRELDGTFREILREAWGIGIPALTPAWRDAVRFWLVVDDNRALLGRLLKEAALAPGRDVKRSFAESVAWIDSARARMNVDAWLGPRRHEIRMKDGARFVVEVEEDPLEVLRMGIPFGTCLALETGCNAASTVLNAIEANKRVIYVRNDAGRVVARKLIAISKGAHLVGYNLYVSENDSSREVTIRAAVTEMCRQIATEAGISVASTGEPANLHKGFWYDDGTVPFEEDVDVAAYCRTLGLPPPFKWFDGIAKEAQGWRASETGDVEAAINVLSAYDSGPANRGLGTWIVQRLGLRSATLRAIDDTRIFIALTRTLADEGEYGMIRALQVGTRMPERATQRQLGPLLARFPPSRKLGVAIVDMGLRAMRRTSRPTKDGLAHLTLTELGETFEDVASALDLLDTIEPVWLYLRDSLPGCSDCVSSAVSESANAVEAIFDRLPDPDVVVATLMSRHRTRTAQTVALRVAARHVLPGGERALVRLATLRPELAASPDGIAAAVRQSPALRVPDALAQRLRRSTPPFEALRELVLRCENLEALLVDDGRVADIDAWSPGPWELAWRRRRHDAELGDGLFARAARSPRTATRPMELLALLGDLRRIGELDHVAPSSIRDQSKIPKALVHDSPLACRRTAASIAEQVEASRRSKVDPDVRAIPHADAVYVDLARLTLLEEGSEAARNVTFDCSDRTVVDWERLLTTCVRDREDLVSARRILEEKLTNVPTTHVIVDAWQHEELRDPLARVIAARQSWDWSSLVWAAEREATARGLSVEGLLERVSLALVSTSLVDEGIEAATSDQLRSIFSALTAEAAPTDLARTYQSLEDTSSVAMFLRALRRQPASRTAELREAVRKLELGTDHGVALQIWLDTTRSSRSPSGATATSERVINT